MFEFIHDIIESWILKAAGQGLGGLRKSLMQSHLRGCKRCRGFALDLVEFSHSLEPGKNAPRFSAADKDDLHARVMAAVHRESRDERMALPFERAAGPLIRPSFVKAMAMLSVILGAAFVLSTPFRQGNVGNLNQSSSDASAGKPHEALLALEPTPSPSPTASGTLAQTPAHQRKPPLTPVALKTENK